MKGRGLSTFVTQLLGFLTGKHFFHKLMSAVDARKRLFLRHSVLPISQLSTPLGYH